MQPLDFRLQLPHVPHRASVDHGAILDGLHAVHKLQRRQCLVAAGHTGRHICNDYGLRVATYGVFQQEGELGVTVGHMASAIGCLVLLPLYHLYDQTCIESCDHMSSGKAIAVVLRLQATSIKRNMLTKLACQEKACKQHCTSAHLADDAAQVGQAEVDAVRLSQRVAFCA